MIDVKDLRENPDKYKKATEDKQLPAALVDRALALDGEWREALAAVEKLRKERNALSKERTAESMSRGKQVKEELKKLEETLRKIEAEWKEALNKIPNPAAPDVKVGKDDTENEIIRKWGEPRKFDFQPKAHWELGESLGIIDTERASKVSGSRFFYLSGEGFLLQRAMENFAIDFLLSEGFVPVIPPVLITADSMHGMGYMEHGGSDDMYILDKDNLVLVGTSEQSIGPLHKNETLGKSQLPLRYMGYSTCFRREAGSYGKDTKGAFRVHQFQKIEMFSLVEPEMGDSEHEYMLALEERLLIELGLPYEVTKMVTGDLGLPAARKYDLNGWFPAEKNYRELTSTSTTTDFQSRRLEIKYNDGEQSRYVHMLNGTAVSQRPILAILENYQQKDGSVKIPEVLQKYMGKKVIKPVK